ncbi:MAG: flippase [Catenisphaera adipataccumulans]|jgi:O-antigen/teichoic acid export membrane protein|uniref:flippase n=1 Tax=Catenisphaera adipataccumulans TaxID=700500 RepID=UPI003D8F54E1
MEQKSVKKNFLMNTLLTMSAFIFPLITYPYVSPILSPSGMGSVSFATSIATYFTMFAQLGIPTYGIRACALARDDKKALTKTVQELLIINVVMMILSYIVFFILLFTVPQMKDEKTLFIVVGSMVWLNCIGMNWMYQGLEEYTFITVWSVVCKTISVVAMLLLVHAKSDYIIYGGLSIFASYGSSLANFFYAHKFIDLKPVGHYHFRKHLRHVGIFFAMSCATTIYTNLDIVMLGFMKTNVDVGYYQMAVKIKNILVSLVTSLGTVMLPRASYYIGQGDMKRFRAIAQDALHFVWLVAVPLAVYTVLFASQGIYFISSAEFTGSILPMQIVMPTLIFIGLTNIIGMQILVPTGNEMYVLYSEIAGAAVDFVINLLLIPHLASAGAAIGTLAAEAVVLGVQYHYTKPMIRKLLKRIPYGKLLAANAAAAVLSVFCRHLELVSSLRWNSFLILAISCILFFVVYLAVLLLLKEPLVLTFQKQVHQWLMRRKEA